MLRRIFRPLRRLLNLLLPIAVILLILFLIIRSWSINHVSKDDLAAESASEIAVDPNAIVNISCQNGSETLAFHLKEDGKWYWIDESFPLDQEAVADFAQLLTTFTPSVTVASGEHLNLDDYELGTPPYSLSFTTAGGVSTTYHFGKATDSGGSYMMTSANGTTVYMAPSSLTALTKKGLYDYCLIDSFPLLSPETVSSFTVQSKETMHTYTRAIMEADSSIYWYNRGRDVTENGTFLACMENLISLSFAECLVWNPVEESIAVCGLDEPRLTVTIQYTDPNQRECELILSIGNERNDTQYFATWSNRNAIYAINKDAVKGLLAAANAI
ncbi:MAG: DUF4340 domain-containing protein [Oscillospiraceae bacterium]|nr:DUF4340 domain-containing protein [Oscillospiraceae bacterium]